MSNAQLEYKETWDLKGRGIFTRVEIPAGTVVLREQFVLREPDEGSGDELIPPVVDMFNSLTPQQKNEYMTLYAVKREADDDAAMLDYFRNLYTKADGSKLSEQEAQGYARVFVIMWANQMGFYDEDGVKHQGVFLRASRFNHKCAPNLIFNIKTNGEIALRARHLIPEGAELTISYIRLGALRTERKQQLMRGFGFECLCDLCDLEDRRADASLYEQRLALLRLHDAGDTIRMYRENEFNQHSMAECGQLVTRCEIRWEQYINLLWIDYGFYELLNISDLWARIWQLVPDNADANNPRAVYAYNQWRKSITRACNLGRIVMDADDWHLVDARRAAASATPMIVPARTPAPEEPAAGETAVTPDGRFLRSGARSVSPTGSQPMVDTQPPGWKTVG
ncbi:SET domain-containing protein [Apiospora hydei]|uniref:SET domain-containing protein n=1 Tax=Apiospora hydei TaxID=1337664 RepID=A0ABR1VGL4_9PEZI